MTLRKKDSKRHACRPIGDLMYVGICRGCGVEIKVRAQETRCGEDAIPPVLIINCPLCGERRELGRG